MGNVNGLFFEDYVYVPKESIIFYITDKGMSNKQKRLTVRFRVADNEPIYKFNAEEDSFDVAEIDPSTIVLEEDVPPLRWSIEDVASPPFDGDVCDCTTAGGDGYLDLVLKFNSREVAAEIPLIEIYLLELQGEKLDGTPISGADCVVPIVPND